MFIPQKGRRACAPVLVTLALLLALAPAVVAADSEPPPETADGWRKVIAYARCAALVFLATTPAQWSGAIFDCARLYLDEPPIGAGGV
jgi:hypothetical protein